MPDRMCKGMICCILASTALLAQAPPAKPASPGDVVATIDGEKITRGKIQQLREILPQQFRQAASRMDNKQFLRSYAELLALSKLAEKEKVTEQAPYKDQLGFLRMNFLAQTYVDSLSKRIQPSQEDLLKYYNEHKSDYGEATVRGIYVAFSPDAGKADSSGGNAKKSVTEEEAQAKAQALLAELKNGSDFAELAKANSDDAATPEKATIKRASSGLPPDVTKAIFGLTPGEVSPAIRQPAGFYIFKLETLRTLPFEEVSVNIATVVQGMKMKEELDRIRNNIKISYDNESFFSSAPAPAPPPPPLRP